LVSKCQKHNLELLLIIYNYLLQLTGISHHL